MKKYNVILQLLLAGAMYAGGEVLGTFYKNFSTADGVVHQIFDLQRLVNTVKQFIAEYAGVWFQGNGFVYAYSDEGNIIFHKVEGFQYQNLESKYSFTNPKIIFCWNSLSLYVIANNNLKIQLADLHDPTQIQLDSSLFLRHNFHNKDDSVFYLDPNRIPDRIKDILQVCCTQGDDVPAMPALVMDVRRRIDLRNLLQPGQLALEGQGCEYYFPGPNVVVVRYTDGTKFKITINPDGSSRSTHKFNLNTKSYEETDRAPALDRKIAEFLGQRDDIFAICPTWNPRTQRYNFGDYLFPSVAYQLWRYNAGHDVRAVQVEFGGLYYVCIYNILAPGNPNLEIFIVADLSQQLLYVGFKKHIYQNERCVMQNKKYIIKFGSKGIIAKYLYDPSHRSYMLSSSRLPLDDDLLTSLFISVNYYNAQGDMATPAGLSLGSWSAAPVFGGSTGAASSSSQGMTWFNNTDSYNPPLFEQHESQLAIPEEVLQWMGQDEPGAASSSSYALDSEMNSRAMPEIPS